MNSKLTPQECVSAIVSSVDRWIAKGLDYKCACIVTAELKEVPYDKVEHFWIKRQTEGIN